MGWGNGVVYSEGGSTVPLPPAMTTIPVTTHGLAPAPLRAPGAAQGWTLVVRAWSEERDGRPVRVISIPPVVPEFPAAPGRGWARRRPREDRQTLLATRQHGVVASSLSSDGSRFQSAEGIVKTPGNEGRSSI